jgi:hypothetical protein
VNGKGTIANKAATVSDLTAAGATGSGPYTVTTSFSALDATSAFSKLNNGDTVKIVSGTNAGTYTYDATAKTSLPPKLLQLVQRQQLLVLRSKPPLVKRLLVPIPLQLVRLTLMLMLPVMLPLAVRQHIWLMAH